MFKEYKSLKGYLERYTVLLLGKLHVRLHKILSEDKTPYLHTHPFHYISIILRGGYTEKLTKREIVHKPGSIILRKNTTAHRIQSVSPNTLTLFFTWKTPNYSWQFKEYDPTYTDNWVAHKSGIYTRMIFNKEVYAKFDKYWHRGHNNIDSARLELNPSIDQTTCGQYVEEI